MKIKVVKGYYAPKINDIIANDDKIHCVVSPRCNFKCRFCEFWQRDNIVFKEISLENFEKVVEHLLPYGKAFKFTGGEPCLNPDLISMLKIVKRKGGICFLDTNGSLFSKVRECLDAGLVDVLAISLKGLDPASCCETSGMPSSRICWNNVLESIRYASQLNIKVIVTYVIHDSISYAEIESFAKILTSLGGNIYLKINNLMVNDYNTAFTPVDNETVMTLLQRFVDNNPSFAGRVIYIENKNAVTDIQSIRHY